MPRSNGVEVLAWASTDSTGSVVLALAVSDELVPGVCCKVVISSTFFSKCPVSPSIVSCPVFSVHASAPIHPHLIRAGRSGCFPLLHFCNELLVRHWNRVPAFTGIPTPHHH